jgi:hypothetical protein
MKLKEEILDKIRCDYSLQNVILTASDKSPLTILNYIRENSEQLTLARYIFPLSAHLATPVEEMIDFNY